MRILLNELLIFGIKLANAYSMASRTSIFIVPSSSRTSSFSSSQTALERDSIVSLHRERILNLSATNQPRQNVDSLDNPKFAAIMNFYRHFCLQTVGLKAFCDDLTKTSPVCIARRDVSILFLDFSIKI